MVLNFSRMAVVGLDNPATRKDIGKWLDQTKGVPQDLAKNKIFYEGVMGSSPIYILSGLNQMPDGVPKTDGDGCDNTGTCRRISLVFFELTIAGLGEHKAIHGGRVVNAYMAWGSYRHCCNDLNHQ